MPRYNPKQERKEKEESKPKIKKAHINQNKLEKEGKFYVVPNLRPHTVIFIKKGENVKEKLENYVKNLTNNNHIYQIKV